MFQKFRNILVMNLSISDCLTCLFAPFYTSKAITGWPHQIFGFLVVWFRLSSLVSITSISIDRFLIVAYPIKHRIFDEG
jgi:hypothetical protein